MKPSWKPLTIDSSAITVAGIGGIGMVALVAIIAVNFPIARWLLIGGVSAGAVLASVLILRRRSRQVGSPGDDLPIELFATRSDDDPMDEKNGQGHGPIASLLRA
jgi:hypothetical protein